MVKIKEKQEEVIDTLKASMAESLGVDFETIELGIGKFEFDVFDTPQGVYNIHFNTEWKEYPHHVTKENYFRNRVGFAKTLENVMQKALVVDDEDYQSLYGYECKVSVERRTVPYRMKGIDEDPDTFRIVGSVYLVRK